ncbi:MAG: hypothetical protein DI606_04470 [Sphingobium sp.]|uniref:hypothetical protein n=1 Tax=Sphingobium sp. TaxID=1912891 RepID=UPI000DB48040|nr:hypothetical protein [Sphingobium sp.]PZU13826.1 MAG: hypothetical protein DI606_04470 [Sphingobium sp.]
MNIHDHDAARYVADGLSLGALIGAIANLLPSIASLLTVIWMLIRIWETESVQRWTRRKD